MQARGIIEALGPHSAYWELFSGSAAVLMAKEPCRQEVINDLHGGLTNLARVVQDDELAPQLFDRLQRTLFCQGLYKDSQDECAAFFMEDPWPIRSLDWAYHYLVVTWMGRNGLAGTVAELDTGFCRRFTSNGGDPAVRFRSVANSTPWWWQRLHAVTVLSEDGISLAERIEDKQGTVIYADPPYVVKEAKYLHDFEGDDHIRLATTLGRFSKTRVVVSYYSHPLLDKLYCENGFRLVERTTTKQMGNGKKEAPEVLLVKN